MQEVLTHNQASPHSKGSGPNSQVPVPTEQRRKAEAESTTERWQNLDGLCTMGIEKLQEWSCGFEEGSSMKKMQVFILITQKSGSLEQLIIKTWKAAHNLKWPKNT